MKKMRNPRFADARVEAKLRPFALAALATGLLLATAGSVQADGTPEPPPPCGDGSPPILPFPPCPSGPVGPGV